MVAEMVASETDTTQLAESINTPMSEGPLLKENVTIFDYKGRKLYSFTQSTNLLPKDAIESIIKNKEFKYSNGNYKAFGHVYTNSAGMQLAIVSDGIFNHLYLNDLKNILIWVFVTTTTFLAFGAWYFARLSLAPVTKIMNQMDEILPTNLNKRLKFKKQKDELSRLANTFNNLLDRMEKAFKTQKMFISNVSHELKNPLNVIISEIEVTLSSEREASEYIHVLKSVLTEIKELGHVSEKLLQLAKLESEMENLTIAPTRIDDLLWQISGVVTKSEPTFKVKINLLNPPDNEDAYIARCNEALLKTALINLVENACKYSCDQTAYLILSIDSGGGIKITVRNKGVGIKKDEIKHIFNPFYRGRQWSNVKGSGVGLALVKSILDHQNFTIQIESNEGGFTDFTVGIPNQKTPQS